MPGLYVEQQTIKTFPTDTVRLKGTASNYVGLKSVTLSCDAWEVVQVYDLSSRKPVVFNYDYQMIVPESASFENAQMDVIVEDIYGQETSKSITMDFLADLVPPAVTPVLLEQISVDFDTESGKGVWSINAGLYDRRGLKQIKVEIPDVSYSETTPLSGMRYDYIKNIEFSSPGNYDATVTVTDMAGNNMVMMTEVIVMLKEDSDPIQNWDGLYLVDSAENPDDYVDGFYKFVQPCYDDAGAVIPYTYQCNFYAPTADTKIYLTSSKTMDGDLIGISPYVSTKLLNKNGYVHPIPVPGAGYYGIWVDLLNGQYSFWEIDPETSATKCSEDIWVSGTGFSAFADWGATAEPMTRDGYRYSQELAVNAGTVQYYFYTAGWARVFRASADCLYWFESARGPCAAPATEYTGPVEMIFDSVLPYGVIKKLTE